MLWDVTLWIEIHGKFDLAVFELFTDRVHVYFPANARIGQHQLARVLRENLSRFANGPFHE